MLKKIVNFLKNFFSKKDTRTGQITVERGGRSFSSRDAAEVEKVKQLYQIAIFLLVVTVLLLAFNLVTDYSTHQRITELEREIADNKVNFFKEIGNLPKEVRIEKIEEDIEREQEILNCLKFKKYWQYGECFVD